MSDNLRANFRNRTRTNRWAAVSSYQSNWAERGQKLLDLFIANECDQDTTYNLAEIGCGANSPIHTLCAQYPKLNVSKFDIKKWDDDTTILDLNDANFSAPQCDVVVLSGVLEYLNDPMFVIERMLQSCDFVILSYAFVTLKDHKSDDRYLKTIHHRAVTRGWRNHYGNMDLVKLLASKGVISAIDVWKDHSLFLLRSSRMDLDQVASISVE